MLGFAVMETLPLRLCIRLFLVAMLPILLLPQCRGQLDVLSPFLARVICTQVKFFAAPGRRSL